MDPFRSRSIPSCIQYCQIWCSLIEGLLSFPGVWDAVVFVVARHRLCPLALVSHVRSLQPEAIQHLGITLSNCISPVVVHGCFVPRGSRRVMKQSQDALRIWHDHTHHTLRLCGLHCSFALASIVLSANWTLPIVSRTHHNHLNHCGSCHC